MHRTPQEPWRFAETTSLSPAEPIPGSPFLNKKRELLPGLSLVLPSLFALPRLIPTVRRESISVSGFTNINVIPFR
jgi:hypothetical protein